MPTWDLDNKENNYKCKYKFNLQLFSEEKTEQATEKKKKDSRQKGQVVQSKEITASILLLTLFVSLRILGMYYVESIMNFYGFCYSFLNQTDMLFYGESYLPLMYEIFKMFVIIMAPLLAIAFITSFLITYLQVGSLFTIEPIKPKLEKINPIKGFKNLFSMKSLIELVKALVKSSILLFITYRYIQGRIGELINMFNYEIGQIIVVMSSMLYGVALRCSLALFIVAVFDYIYKRWKNNKDLMMTKQEVKDEYKQSEGDPQVKGKIKQKQREVAMRRMMQDVPDADVIITNPTHFAVALKYDEASGMAPIVIAKGQDLIAQNIKKKARENDVPIVENKPLARQLFAEVEIGDVIPPELYEAVAEVLAYVYRLNH